jgi:hypothetical protein
MPTGGTGSKCVAHFILATTTYLGRRSGTRAIEERFHRNFRPQNTTVPIPKRTLQLEIEVAPSWRNRIVNTNGTFDLPYSFVILIRGLRIREDLTHTRLSFTFSA